MIHMSKIPCTVGILTFNSAATLGKALESVKEFDDVLICDGGSTDATRSIALEYGCRIIDQSQAFKNQDGTLADYAGVRNQCLDEARYDWFFYIDSDEVATAELVDEIARVIAGPSSHSVYSISPRIVLDGLLIEHSSNYPGWQQRLFRRSTGARFRKAVHERIAYDRSQYSAGFLRGHWHYFVSVQRALDPEKNEKYARMDASLHPGMPVASLLRQTWSKLATALKIILKGSYNRARYGARASMPLRLEWVRVRYHFRILQLIWGAYFRKRHV